METNQVTGMVMVPMTDVEAAIRSVMRDQEKRRRNDTGHANAALGAELMRFRMWVHVSRQRLADEAGVSVSTIQKIETGVRGVSFETYIKLLNLERVRRWKRPGWRLCQVKVLHRSICHPKLFPQIRTVSGSLRKWNRRRVNCQMSPHRQRSHPVPSRLHYVRLFP